MASKINMRGMQEGVEDGVKQASDLGRKAFLATLGVAGLGYDLGKSIFSDGNAWLEKAEKRGTAVEGELRKTIAAFQADFPGEVTKLAQNIEVTVNSFAKDVTAQTQRVTSIVSQFTNNISDNVSETVVDIQLSTEETAKKAATTVQETAKKAASTVQNTMQSVADSVQKNGADAVKSAKIETPAAVQDAVESAQKSVESAVDKLWSGYDELSVKDIVAGLEGKSMSTLEYVRAHEIAGKNRVTVVREIDTHIQAMTS